MGLGYIFYHQNTFPASLFSLFSIQTENTIMFEIIKINKIYKKSFVICEGGNALSREFSEQLKKYSRPVAAIEVI